MSSVHCPECGAAPGKKTNSWIGCPKYPAPDGSPFRSLSICDLHCLTCEYHIRDGTSLEWCGYRRKHPEPQEEKPAAPMVNAIEMQMRRKLGKADYFYRTGKTRIADNLSHEAAMLEMELRRMRKDA